MKSNIREEINEEKENTVPLVLELQNKLSKEEKKEVESTTETNKYKNEKYGIFLILCCQFIRAFNSLVVKFTQKTYKDLYHTVPFLFYRAICIFFFAQILTTLTGEHILWPSEIKQRTFFLIRTNVNFFGVQFFLTALWYLRVATVLIIQSLSPLVVTILSFFILKEKFFFRYIIGIVICASGSLFIVLNERKGNNEADAKQLTEEEKKSQAGQQGKEEFSTGTLIGLFFAITDIFFNSIIDVANKVLVNNRIPFNTQAIYVAIFTSIYSLIYLFYTHEWEVCFGYLVCIFIQGINFYAGNFFFNAGLRYVDLSKAAPLNYSRVIFALIFGSIFLGESVFWTDILGICLIFSYLFYDITHPLHKKSK